MMKMLFFYARWCGPCRRMKRDFMDRFVAGHPGQAEMHDVDIKVSLAERYDVCRLPTIVLLKDGKVYKKIEGAVNEEEIRTWLREA